MNLMLGYWCEAFCGLFSCFYREGGFLGVCKGVAADTNFKTPMYQGSIHHSTSLAGMQVDNLGGRGAKAEKFPLPISTLRVTPLTEHIM